MRDNRFFIKVGLLILALLTGLLALIPMMRVSNPALPAAEATEVMGTGAIVLAGLVAVIVITLGMVFLAVQFAGRGGMRKQKREDIDRYLADLLDEGHLHLQPDGELPDWDRLYDDKAKRMDELADDHREQA